MRESFCTGRRCKRARYRVLHNPMYYGTFRWGNKLCPSIHEPFITKELFERANKALSLFEHPRVTTRNYSVSAQFYGKN